MTVQVEVESKLQLEREGFERLLKHGRVKRMVEQLNVYYDHNWKLAESNSTFRVRFVPGARPAVTLKVVLAHRGHERVAREVEQPCGLAFPMRPLSRAISRSIDVERDLAPEYRSELLGLNLTCLSRVGWMRNRRHVVEFEHVGVLEADWVRLPSGEEFFEVEVETEDVHVRTRLVELVHTIAPTCSPSLVSKFERFRRSLMAHSHQVSA